ncbi:hypothetical protein SASPL_136594 [Salvia splendens]|uniref:Uncharacterized protein n=1 Tax=Salvia splendens TaxID=180675 RepID=A0A8X8X038_SALSN|nr:hypothetical protein SASPL_136594 [Salvia splendens]
MQRGTKMEVSKETWVCSTDFIRLDPERPRRAAAKADAEPPMVKKRASVEKSKPRVPEPPRRNNDSQPDKNPKKQKRDGRIEPHTVRDGRNRKRKIQKKRGGDDNFFIKRDQSGEASRRGVAAEEKARFAPRRYLPEDRADDQQARSLKVPKLRDFLLFFLSDFSVNCEYLAFSSMFCYLCSV